MGLNVVQLGPVPPPEGGVSRNLFAIRDALLSEGSRCEVVATTKGGAGDRSADVHRPRTAIEMLRVLRNLGADVVHLHLGGELTARVLALAAAVTVLTPGKRVLTMHSGGFPTSRAGRAASPATIAAAVFRRFDMVIAVNHAIADVFARYGIEPRKIAVIPPYDLRLPPADVELPLAVAEFMRERSPLLLSVGGLEPEYQPMLQIEALKELLPEFPRAGLIFVGSGMLKMAAEQAAASAGVAENTLFAGDMEHPAVLKLIQTADVLLRTTLYDGDAISVREAMFLGTPVIATPSELRPEGVFLLENSDPRHLAEKIAGVAGRSAASGLAIRPPADEIKTENNIEKVLSAYRQLLEGDI